jgi:hypothetical protein
MASQSWFRTSRVWVLVTLTLFILAFTAHFGIQFIGGYNAGAYLDMIPHFLFGAAICAFFLNLSISRAWKKALPIVPPLLMIILPALLYTLAAAFAWEVFEEALSIFYPWLNIYSDFWWNGVRDIIMGLFGATLTAGIYLWYFPAIVKEQEAGKGKRSKTRQIEYVPGKSFMHYCESCGSVVDPDSKHCSNCGHKL